MADIISIDTSEVTTFLKVNLGEKLPKGFDTRKVVSDIADFVSAYMKVRTLKGRDVDNQAFTPYAERTKKRRASKKKGGGRQVAFVDLFDTGLMMGGIGKQMGQIPPRILNDHEAIIAPFDKLQGIKAISHQLGLGHLPKRRFFGISDTDPLAVKGIEKITEDELDRAIKNV